MTDVVLVETVWTLQGSRYKQGREAIARVVEALFREPAVCFEDAQAVWCAMADYRSAPPVKVGGKRKFADFPDALICNKAARWAAEQGEDLGGTLTIDQAFLALADTQEPD